MSSEYNIRERNMLCNLDRLRQLIKNCRQDGKFTIAKSYQDYYTQVITNPKIKDLIKETIHEIPIEQEDSPRIDTSTE